MDRIAHHKSSLRHSRHDNDYLQKAWNKYGEENFIFDILEICDSEDALDELERKYIKEYNSMDRNFGYNFESGGSANKHMSEDVKKRLSEIAKGKYAGEKNPMYGVHLKCSEEKKKLMSERFSGSGNPMYGVHLKLTDEQKQKISERTKGEKNPFYGKKHTEEARKKILETRKKSLVRCIETGKIYESAMDAMRDTGIHNGSILRAAKNNLTAGGFHWELVA